MNYFDSGDWDDWQDYHSESAVTDCHGRTSEDFDIDCDEGARCGLRTLTAHLRVQRKWLERGSRPRK